jgi:hypothetical protein
MLEQNAQSQFHACKHKLQGKYTIVLEERPILAYYTSMF